MDVIKSWKSTTGGLPVFEPVTKFPKSLVKVRILIFSSTWFCNFQVDTAKDTYAKYLLYEGYLKPVESPLFDNEHNLALWKTLDTTKIESKAFVCIPKQNVIWWSSKKDNWFNHLPPLQRALTNLVGRAYEDS